MKKTLLSIFIISVLSVPISVRASEVDGKSLHCQPAKDPAYRVTDGALSLPYALFFDRGNVKQVIISGYKTVTLYIEKYELEGTSLIKWKYKGKRFNFKSRVHRDTLRHISEDHPVSFKSSCEVVSAKRNYELLNNVINQAKKKNKI